MNPYSTRGHPQDRRDTHHHRERRHDYTQSRDRRGGDPPRDPRRDRDRDRDRDRRARDADQQQQQQQQQQQRAGPPPRRGFPSTADPFSHPFFQTPFPDIDAYLDDAMADMDRMMRDMDARLARDLPRPFAAAAGRPRWSDRTGPSPAPDRDAAYRGGGGGGGGGGRTGQNQNRYVQYEIREVPADYVHERRPGRGPLRLVYAGTEGPDGERLD